MPDEPETPATPDTLTPAADTDWQARYTSLQPEYTRATQALKDRESAWEDDTAVLSRLQELRPDLFEDDDEDEETEPPERAEPQPDPRIEWLATREADRQYQEDLTEAVGERKIVGKQANNWIKARSRDIAAASNKPWNKAALKTAVDEYFEFVDDVRGPQRKDVPVPPPPGTAGEKKYDPRNKEERRARMAASIEAARQQ